jgi:septal ring factor EnvC (AmiA/AmiB activator)
VAVFSPFSDWGAVRVYRKHKRGAQIPCLLTATILVFGCCSLLFAKNTKKTIAEYKAPKQATTEYDKKIEEKNAVLDSIRAELQKGREKLSQLQSQEGTVLTQLSQLENNIATSESYLREVSVKIDSTSRSIARLGNQLAAANRDLEVRQSIMKKRLRAIYKAGQVRLPQLILTSRNMSDMLHRVRYFSELNRYDRQLVAKIDTARKQIEADKTVLERQQRRLSLFKRDKEGEYGSLVAEQESRQKLLSDVRVRKDTFVKMIRELEAAQKELQNIVAMLEKNRKKKTPTAYEKSLNATFEKEKGSLPWPMEGKVVTDFGKVVHSVYKTVTMNTGIDIASRAGEKVYCVASGKVAYVGWMRGLGKLVIVDHGGYYTTYARLEDALVAKDDKVQPGTAIGMVGEINPIDGPKLHFEIRKSTEALDPMDWLEKRKK